MKTRLFVAATLMLLGTLLFAQSEAGSAPVLKNADVENFIKHFPDIKAELEDLDLDIDPQDDLESLTDGLASYEEINSVVKKYGYSDYYEFASKTTVIAACYASVKIDTEGTPEIEQAYKEIENNTSMTPEQKQLAKQQLDAILAAMGGSITTMANEKDIETVKAYVSQLDSLFDEE